MQQQCLAAAESGNTHGISARPNYDGEPLEIAGYAIEQRVAVGGFGSVYTAIRQSDGAPVAIKVARADIAVAGLQLVRETVVLRALGPTIAPRVCSAGRLASGVPFVVMEYIAWPTLEQLVASYGNAMKFDVLGRCAAATTRAVAALHQRGLCHCDLKPSNVLVRPDGAQARLIDFGLARVTDSVGVKLPGDPPVASIQPASSARSVASVVSVVSIEGTSAYMSPEQCMGDLVDQRSDVYALGVVLYQLVAGRTPFRGNRIEIHQAHRNLRVRRPSHHRPTPLALEEVIMKCLAKSPRRRYRDAGELGTALAVALSEAGSVCARASIARP